MSTALLPNEFFYNETSHLPFVLPIHPNHQMRSIDLIRYPNVEEELLDLTKQQTIIPYVAEYFQSHS